MPKPKTYILVTRMRDPSQRYRGEIIRGVKSALYIPTGMQGLEGRVGTIARRKVTPIAQGVASKLVKKGIPKARAQQITSAAVLNVFDKRRGRFLRAAHGLGEDWRDTDLNTTILIPPGMQGLGQFHNRAAGYMQVEPAYERAYRGLGDLRQDITELIAGRELDKLMTAVRNLNDEVVRGIEFRDLILNQYKEAKTLLNDAVQRFGPVLIPFGPAPGPNPLVVPAYTAMTAAKKGVQILARQVQTLGVMDQIFGNISAELTRIGSTAEANGIDQTLAQVRRFVMDTDNRFSPLAPEYMQAKNDITMRAKGLAGAFYNSANDPRWLATYIKAANEVVPIPQPSAPSEVVQAGMGAIPLIATMVFWIVGIVAAAVVASKAISQVIDAMNSKAITARDIAIEAEKRKAEDLARLRAKGASQAEINAAMSAIDSSTKDAVASIPESGFPGTTAVVGLLAAAIAAKMAGVF